MVRNQCRPTFPPITFTENQDQPTSSSAPSTSFTRNQDQPTSSSAPSRSLTGNQYRPTLPSTSITRNKYQPTSSSAPSTSFTRNQDQPTSSSAPSTSFTRNQDQPTSSSAPSTSFTKNQTSSAPSTIVSGSIHNEDNSDNLSNSLGSSTVVSENENNAEYSSMMMASTHNTCIDIMSNRVYSKAGAYYSCIMPSCRLFFKTFHKLKMHYRHHRNVNGLMCWTCLQIYPNKSELRKHKFQDSCKFPGMFVCVLCNKSFNDLQSISHHKYIKHINN
ncbi:zinc finger protein 341-like [Aphis craccivora]|uniref:Zinc finger protein 341-like n=1 Tax=Aphis craccivora TaxID=307492 RepID=A0A6G0Z1Z8_APHCR|nr:zinc finger protein 341-like [Aphis craccivora]